MIILKVILLTISIWYWIVVIGRTYQGSSVPAVNIAVPSIATAILYYLP